MTLPLPKTLRRAPDRASNRAIRLVAAVVTVVVILLLGTLVAGREDDEGPRYHHYVALGDSYTAAPFVPFTVAARGCYRSGNNYPHLLARELQVEDLQDRSCSGAQTKDLLGRQLTMRGLRVPPQLDALSGRTDLVTVGIGANDGHLYARIATKCRRSRHGCPLYDERHTLQQILDRLRPTLTTTLGEVRNLAPNARILLIGYPRLFPPLGDCDRLPRMRPQDRDTFRAINRRLRDEMRAAAHEAKVEFVDFYAVSYAHDVCARDPWIQGRVGNYRLGAALHPLPAGQDALARTIEQVLRHEPAKPTNG